MFTTTYIGETPYNCKRKAPPKGGYNREGSQKESPALIIFHELWQMQHLFRQDGTF